MQQGDFTQPAVFHMHELLKAEEDAFKQWRYLYDIAPELHGDPKEGVISFNVGSMVKLAAALKAQYRIENGRVTGVAHYKDEEVQLAPRPPSA
jgi:hypothetical protein